jgi:hypothetical protein
MRAARFKANLILTYSSYIPYTAYNLQVRSGSNQFEPVLKIAGHSGPLTGPMVRFFPRHEPWTEPRSGSAAFRFEPWF